MKFIIKTILIASLCYFTGLFLPFWALAVVAFVVSLLIHTSGWNSFLSGFIAVFMLWGVLAYGIDQSTNSILTDRVAQVFMGIPNIALILITGFIGGIIVGLGAATGSLFIDLVAKKKVSKYY